MTVSTGPTNASGKSAGVPVTGMSDGDRIGGGESAPRYAALFVAGTAVGTVVRTAMWLLPDGFVDRVKGLLPGQ